MEGRKRAREAGARFQAGRHACAYCWRNVRGEAHVRHLDSADVALCIECYTVGVKVHGTTTWGWEKCHVVEAAASGRPLLVEDWLADQEVGLLDGILRYGFGNWHAVAEHMGDNKTEASCEEHYTSFYLRQKTFPLPDLSGPRPVTPAPEKVENAEEAPKPSALATNVKGEVQRRGASGMILDGQRVAPADLIGYMPLRGEYDTEWDNDAELQVCDVDIGYAESPEALAAKLKLLDTYNRQLDERQCRHDFITKHEVQERMARHHAMDRRLSRDERQFRARVRPYAQHTLPDEHEVLTRAMIRERDVRRRLDHFRGCARVGITRLNEAETLWRIALAQEDPHLKRDAPISRSVAPGVATTTAIPAAAPVGAGTGAAGGDSAYGCQGAPLSTGAAAPVAMPNLHTAKLASVRAAAAASSAGRVDGVPGCVQAHNLLSASEAKACVSLGLVESQYVACKRAQMLSVAKRASSPPSTSQADAAPKLEQHRSQQLHAYIQRNGWMS